MNRKLDNLKIENLIWVIYIIVAISAIISNYYEKQSIIKRSKKDADTYHTINRTIFTVGIFIYIYFLYQNIIDKNSKFHNLEVFAATLFFIGGIIYLYVETKKSENTEEEVGLI